DRSPVSVERFDGPLARLALHLDITKTCHAEQVCKPLRICQRKTEVERCALLGEMATERVGKDAPHRGPIRRGDDADGGTPARTEHASELRETPRGIRKKLQAELAHDGIKAAIPERQRLAIRGHGLKRFLARAGRVLP